MSLLASNPANAGTARDDAAAANLSTDEVRQALSKLGLSAHLQQQFIDGLASVTASDSGSNDWLVLFEFGAIGQVGGWMPGRPQIPAEQLVTALSHGVALAWSGSGGWTLLARSALQGALSAERLDAELRDVTRAMSRSLPAPG
jgi:hypothetical protein